MSAMRAWTGRLLVAVAAMSFVASPLAACAEAMMPAHQQMACCEEHHDCDPAMKAADCCGSSQTRPHQQTATKTEPVQKNPVVFSASVHPASAWAPALIRVMQARLVAVAPVDTGPPDCIAFSILLI